MIAPMMLSALELGALHPGRIDSVCPDTINSIWGRTMSILEHYLAVEVALRSVVCVASGSDELGSNPSTPVQRS